MYVMPGLDRTDPDGKARLKVRDADLLDLIPEQGREVPETGYWHRRLRDGDVVLGKAPANTLDAAEVITDRSAV